MKVSQQALSVNVTRYLRPKFEAGTLKKQTCPHHKLTGSEKVFPTKWGFGIVVVLILNVSVQAVSHAQRQPYIKEEELDVGI